MAAPTFQDIYDMGKAEAILRRPDLAVKEGDISDMFLAGAAAMADRVVGYAAERFNATYLDGARGDDLSRLTDDHWNVQRQTANKSTGTVTITRSSADATATSYPVGAAVATARDAQGNEVRYLLTQAATWAVSTNGARTVNVEAEVAGVASNLSAANLITRMSTSPPAGGSYAITASSSTAGGTEDETDDELRARARAYPATLRRGTISALEQGALGVSGVKKASAVEDDSGALTVYVTDAAGGATGGSVIVSDEVVDDGSMTHDVAIELEEWRAAGSLVTVTGGTLQSVNVTVQLTVRAGTNVAQLVTQVQATVESTVNRLRIGETLYKSLIQTAARLVDPDNILECTVTLPLTDTAPTTSGYIIRAGTVTVT